MLHHHQLGQVIYDHRAQREGEAEAQRLVLEARGRSQRRAWRRQLVTGLERLLMLMASPTRRAGTSC
jgi:hypothetical protein